MSKTQRLIAGFISPNKIATALPTIPGLVALGIFGSGGDANNGNRVVGGSSFVNLVNAPTFQPNYMDIGVTTGPSYLGIDTGVIETTSVGVGGWTMFCVAKMPAGAGNNVLMSIGLTGGYALRQNPANTNFSSHPSIYGSSFGINDATDAGIDLGAGNLLSNWKMFAVTWPGGTAQPMRYDALTDGLTHTTVTTYTRAGGAANHMCFGYNFPTAGAIAEGDLACAGIATTPMNAGLLASVRTSLQGLLALNGVTGF